MKLIGFILFVSTVVQGQARFWDTQRKAESVFYGATIASDGWATRLEISNGAHERDPFAAPFVKQGIIGQVGSSVLGLAVGIVPSYLLYRSGHRKLSRIWLHVCTASESITAGLMVHKAIPFLY